MLTWWSFTPSLRCGRGRKRKPWFCLFCFDFFFYLFIWFLLNLNIHDRSFLSKIIFLINKLSDQDPLHVKWHHWTSKQLTWILKENISVFCHICAFPLPLLQIFITVCTIRIIHTVFVYGKTFLIGCVLNRMVLCVFVKDLIYGFSQPPLFFC